MSLGYVDKSVCEGSTRIILSNAPLPHPGRRLSHNYESSPPHSKEKLANDDMDANPIYNHPSPLTTIAEIAFSYSDSGTTSLGARVVDNSLYETNPNGDAVIYDEIGSKLGNESTDVDNSMSSSITTNVAYATSRNKKQTCIDNPVYGMPASKGTENPPMYSVPRPASLPKNEGNRNYAPLSNSSSPSHASSTTSTEQTTQMPSGLGVHEEPGYYAVPADVSAPQNVGVGPDGGKGVSAEYSRLQHTEVKEGQDARLALDSGTGYQALEQGH